MNFIGRLSIVLLTSHLCLQIQATELTVFAYLKNHPAQVKELLTKIVIIIGAQDTLTSIKQKILTYNILNNNCLRLLSTELSADELPALNHMSRVQAVVSDDEIEALHKIKGASVSMVFSEDLIDTSEEDKTVVEV